MPNKTDMIEALLFAAEGPLPLKKIAQLVALPPREVMAEIDALREEKERIGALQIIELAGGWQIVTKPQHSALIARLREEKRQRLSRAAFEVLAIVAYRQPATRAEVEALRGVDCAGSLQFLLEKKLLAFAGRKDAPGRPWLYATTPRFLDHFGLRDIADLPSLSELAQLNEAAPEVASGEAAPEAADGSLARHLFGRGAMKDRAEMTERQTVEAEQASDSRGGGDNSDNGEAA